MIISDGRLSFIYIIFYNTRVVFKDKIKKNNKDEKTRMVVSRNITSSLSPFARIAFGCKIRNINFNMCGIPVLSSCRAYTLGKLSLDCWKKFANITVYNNRYRHYVPLSPQTKFAFEGIRSANVGN